MTLSAIEQMVSAQLCAGVIREKESAMIRKYSTWPQGYATKESYDKYITLSFRKAAQLAVTEQEEEVFNSVQQLVYLGLGNHAKSYPLYFLAPDLTIALANSGRPEYFPSVPWFPPHGVMLLPFEAMGPEYTALNTPAPIICWMRSKDNDLIYISSYWKCVLIGRALKLERSPEGIKIPGHTTGIKAWNPNTDEIKEESPEQQQRAVEMTDELLSIFFGAVTYFTQKKNVASVARASRPMTVGKKKKQLYNPVFIGNDFSLPSRESLGGTHASPRTHWRRGHWRTQHYGQGNKKIKQIFLPPQLINAGGDSDES